MSDAPKAWSLNYGDDVQVHVDDSSADETFTIAVFKDGGEVERHEGVTAATVTDLTSEHFSAEAVEAPTAAE